MADISQFRDLYPSLHALRVSSRLLLAIVDDSDNGSDLEALRVPSHLTNRTLLELHSFLNRNPYCTYYTLWRWVLLLLSDTEQRSKEFPTIKSIRQSVLRLSARLSILKKMPSSSEKVALISEFLSQPYTLPRVFVSRGKVFVSSSDESSCSSCPSMKTIVRESKQKMYATHRNGQKRLKRRDDLIKQQGKQLKEDEQVMSDLQEKATKSEKLLIVYGIELPTGSRSTCVRTIALMIVI